MNRRFALLLVLVAALAGAATAWITHARGQAPRPRSSGRRCSTSRGRSSDFELADQAGRAVPARQPARPLDHCCSSASRIAPTSARRRSRRWRRCVASSRTCRPAKYPPSCWSAWIRHATRRRRSAAMSRTSIRNSSASPASLPRSKSWRAISASPYHRSAPPQDDGNYTVDHTAAIFLIDPSAAFAAVFGSPHVAGRHRARLPQHPRRGTLTGMSRSEQLAIFVTGPSSGCSTCCRSISCRGWSGRSRARASAG